jgi:hypothetical protein
VLLSNCSILWNENVAIGFYVNTKCHACTFHPGRRHAISYILRIWWEADKHGGLRGDCWPARNKACFVHHVACKNYGLSGSCLWGKYL